LSFAKTCFDFKCSFHVLKRGFFMCLSFHVPVFSCAEKSRVLACLFMCLSSGYARRLLQAYARRLLQTYARRLLQATWCKPLAFDAAFLKMN